MSEPDHLQLWAQTFAPTALLLPTHSQSTQGQKEVNRGAEESSHWGRMEASLTTRGETSLSMCHQAY